MDNILQQLSRLQGSGDFISVLLSASRYILPVLALWLLIRCVCSMLAEQYEPEIWGYLKPPR